MMKARQMDRRALMTGILGLSVGLASSPLYAAHGRVGPSLSEVPAMTCILQSDADPNRYVCGLLSDDCPGDIFLRFGFHPPAEAICPAPSPGAQPLPGSGTHTSSAVMMIGSNTGPVVLQVVGGLPRPLLTLRHGDHPQPLAPKELDSGGIFQVFDADEAWLLCPLRGHERISHHLLCQ